MEYCSIFIKLLVWQSLAAVALSQGFDFFYFVQQWSGSYCDTSSSCCYPTYGQPPADFGIHGLWPNYNSGSYPSNCDSSNPFDPSQIQDLLSQMQTEWPSLSCPSSDGTSFWSHEWDKHGTCSESVLNEHSYFAAALSLKNSTNLLQTLANAGITPNGNSYNLSDILAAIKQGIRYDAAIQCNTDQNGNSQIFQVYICVDTTGQNIIECPVYPTNKCPSSINFPTFPSS
uniref:S-like ribonuclease n=1 Tax=Aldrovanda vesiculosa TaxID=173386 RepID=U6C766_9CARY|nr:S-like ribonuclease [Aldrovanda vesiculosa]